MPWLSRGLREGVVTTPWPAADDAYERSSRSGIAQVRADMRGLRRPDTLEACPTGALVDAPGGTHVDAARCIGCGACVHAFPEMYEFGTGPAPAAYVVDGREAEQGELEKVRGRLAARTRRLGRSVHLRHVDAGSDGSEEWEINALFNPVYDVNRLGLFLTASPRHADILLVTGIGATGMIAPLERTWDGMPAPKVVVAVGTDACSGGVWSGSHAGSDGVTGAVPVDVWVPGSPPPPFAILRAILVALGRMPPIEEAAR